MLWRQLADRAAATALLPPPASLRARPPQQSVQMSAGLTPSLQSGHGCCLLQGLWFSRLLSLFGDKEARILVLGLDNAGKTTILCELPSKPLGLA